MGVPYAGDCQVPCILLCIISLNQGKNQSEADAYVNSSKSAASPGSLSGAYTFMGTHITARSGSNAAAGFGGVPQPSTCNNYADRNTFFPLIFSKKVV